ncbi:MAG: hypothetical protein ACOYN4_15070 [Bacteroidales bacterium]
MKNRINHVYLIVQIALLPMLLISCAKDIAPTASTCGMSITINHVAGSVAPVNKTVTYGTVTNIPGEPTKCWITQNLGASKQAIAVDDATEAATGWYWQFNRKQGFKHDGTTLTPSTTWISSANDNSNWIATNDPCTLELGNGWRLPSRTEWSNVHASGNWYTCDAPFSSDLKLHAGGYLDLSDGSLENRGFNGLYWSSTQHDESYGWTLDFACATSFISWLYKANGYTTRCLKD